MFRLRRVECAAVGKRIEESDSREFHNARRRSRTLSKRLREMPRRQRQWKKAAGLDVLLQHETHEFHQRETYGRNERWRNILEDYQWQEADAQFQNSLDRRTALAARQSSANFRASCEYIYGKSFASGSLNSRFRQLLPRNGAFESYFKFSSACATSLTSGTCKIS